MANPSLTFGATTVDLGFPTDSGNSRIPDETVIRRRTLAGTLRTTVISFAWRYQLTFGWTLIATYDAVVALWRAAEAAGGYPTFTWTDAWPTAAAVPVGLEIGALDLLNADMGSYRLTLTEVSPR